jgi:tellurite resistance protein TerC
VADRQFHWILYVFGAFLLLTGIKMIMAAGKSPTWKEPAAALDDRNTARSPAVTTTAERCRSAKAASGKYTPLFIVIVLIGITDVIFAVDSIPAIFAITDRPLHRADLERVRHPRPARDVLPAAGDGRPLPPAAYGLALVLMFIGVKMLLIDVYKIPIGLSLGVVAATIGTTIALSLLRPPPPAR